MQQNSRQILDVRTFSTQEKSGQEVWRQDTEPGKGQHSSALNSVDFTARQKTIGIQKNEQMTESQVRKPSQNSDSVAQHETYGKLKFQEGDILQALAVLDWLCDYEDSFLPK